MKDIKEIIAKNLVALRKKHGLTQNELAKKLDYSDNTISRWENAELSPSIETLQKISEVYNIPLYSLLEEDFMITDRQEEKNEKIHKLSITALSVSIVWLMATIVFVYGNLILKQNLWTSFIWAIPLSFVAIIPFNEVWGTPLYKCLLISGLTWTLLLSIYLQLLQYNLWLIFIIGVPAQLAIIVWIFLRKNKHYRNKLKNKNNIE